MSTLYLVRHGQASFGQGNYDKLSEMGIRQSRILAGHFQSAGKLFDIIYTGGMVRHRETANELVYLCRENSIHVPEEAVIEEFAEYDSEAVLSAIIPEMLQEDPSVSGDVKELFTDNRSFQKIFETAVYRWISGNYKNSEIMRWDEFVSRVFRGIEMIMQKHGKGKRVALFTSGGPIAVTVKKAMNLSDKDTVRLSWQIVNASVTRFKFTHDRIMLSSFNEYSHLEISSQNELITYR